MVLPGLESHVKGSRIGIAHLPKVNSAALGTWCPGRFVFQDLNPVCSPALS